MKKGILALVGLCMAFLVAACGGSGEAASSRAAAVSAGPHRVLVAYFSRTGNTAALARVIQQETKGDLFEIRPAEPYPESYDDTVTRFQRERDGNVRPAMAENVQNIADYDVVFIGYPNWGSDMPPVVKTFLSQNQLSGKTVIPFCTNGGGGWGHSLASLSQLCPDASIPEGYEMRGGSVDTGRVADWLRRIGL